MSGPGTRADRRFPRAVFARGDEPDARFSLANERTFLAWIRTALALLAGGVALEALSLPVEPHWRLAASVLLIVLGIVAPVQAWLGWARAERALRERLPLPAPGFGGPLAAGVLIAGVLVLIGLLLR
jgi:putative membrane protein